MILNLRNFETRLQGEDTVLTIESCHCTNQKDRGVQRTMSCAEDGPAFRITPVVLTPLDRPQEHRMLPARLGLQKTWASNIETRLECLLCDSAASSLLVRCHVVVPNLEGTP